MKPPRKKTRLGRKPQRDEVVKGTGQVEKEEPVTKTVGEERPGPRRQRHRGAPE